MKHLSTINKELKKDAAILLMNVDLSGGRVSYQCYVPSSFPISASDWAESMVDKIGGKQGGKGDTV